MTSYTINGKYVGINIGTFIAIGNTVSFTNGVKDGWVLCDVSTRPNTNGYGNWLNCQYRLYFTKSKWKNYDGSNMRR